MAQAPMPMPMPPAGGADPTGGMMGGADPSGDADSDDNVLVTICSDGQGGYTVYAGDEPEEGSGADMSEDDADLGPDAGAPAPGGGAPAPEGQPADSVGSALKIAMDMLNAAKSSAGAPGDADSQFAAGFSGSQSPTPASGPAQKY